MGDAVHEALVQIVIKEGGLSREASEAYLRNLSNAYKYQADVFD
jgi:sulfite reductase alpha subunit-like flavoprotein